MKLITLKDLFLVICTVTILSNCRSTGSEHESTVQNSDINNPLPCADGLVCRGDSNGRYTTSPTCHASYGATLGQHCDGNTPCGSDLVCRQDGNGHVVTDTTCHNDNQKAKLNERCEGENACDKGLVCRGDTNGPYVSASTCHRADGAGPGQNCD